MPAGPREILTLKRGSVGSFGVLGALAPIKQASLPSDLSQDVDSLLPTETRSLAWLRRSLARDTAALVLGLCLLAAILMGLAAREVLESGLRNNVESELNREFGRAQAGLDAWRASQRAQIASFANDPELIGALSRGEAGSPAARRRLAQLLELNPEALGFAIVRGRNPGAEISAGSWLPDQWASRVDTRALSRAGAGIGQIDGMAVKLVRVPLKLAGGQTALLAALNPLVALEDVNGQLPARAAVIDENGELVAGTQSTLELARSTGFSEARDSEGALVLSLRRKLSGTPWQLALAEPIATAPSGTIMIVVLASLLIASVAGVVAFAIGVWRLRPLLELADGARRLAAGETGVRVDVREGQDEVQRLARSFNEMAGQLEVQRRALEDRNQDLLRANEVLEQLSITDGLTHLHNHRHFHDQFAREVKRAERSSQPLCLLLVDIDDFKLLNDRYGHAAGDRVLAVTAQLMNEQVRESDYLARYGGEEFAILVAQTTLEGAVALAEKVRAVLSTHRFPLPDSDESVGVTVSIGVAEHSTTTDATFDAADRALYEAKGAGKDCVIAAPPLDRPPSAAGRKRR